MLPELLKGGRYESSGSFTVDLARAADKLGRYQSAEPLFFLLKFVQAAVVAGATEIRIDRVSTGIRLQAEGVTPFPVAEVTTFELDERPQSYLGLGVGAAIAAGATRVLCGVGSSQLVAAPDGSRVAPFQGTGFSVLIEGLQKLERSRLHQRLAYAPLPIWLDGKLLNYVSAPVATRRLPKNDDRRHGVACTGPFERKRQRYEDELPVPAAHGFTVPACTGPFRRENVYVPICGTVLELRDPKLPSRVVLVKHGVALDTSPTLKIPGAHCVVSAQGLHLDVSTLGVVHDAQFAELTRRLDREVREFYQHLVRVFGRELETKGPSLWQGLLVALCVMAGVVMVVCLVACFAGGEAPTAAAGGGCSFGDGCSGGGGSSPPRDALREQLMEILRPN